MQCVLLGQSARPASNGPTTKASEISPDRHDLDWDPVQYNKYSVHGLVESAHEFSGEWSDCRLRVEVPPGSSKVFTVSLRRADKTIFSFHAHTGTTFFLHGKIFFYTDYRPDAPGGDIVAVDPTAGEEIWRTTLDSITTGDSQTSCENRISFNICQESHDNWKTSVDRLEAFREEGGQRYLQLMDLDTGKTIGHHLYDPKRDK
jgi:outer membrane protein assembly factor BamB